MGLLWRFLFLRGPACDPAIPLLGIYPEKIMLPKDTCIPRFKAALSTIARTWKQRRCPSTDDCIKKMSHTHTHTYTHTEEYYSVIKRMKECHLQKMYRYRYLEGMMCVISQTEKHKHPVITYM